jgi:predicted alpha/beta-hydrolase family hydrolase
MRELETPQGTARVLEQAAPGAWARLFLGHGAGGSVSAPDLQVAARTALEEGVSVALVEQPYRVAGKKSTPRPPVLDEAWVSVVEQVNGDGLPHISGGRSSGARVACRTAQATGAIGVLALAFPLNTPSGASRQDELDAVAVPLLVVQGVNDRFGMPDGAVQVQGDHGLKGDRGAIAEAIRTWLKTLRT